jgi:hypothetical protein
VELVLDSLGNNRVIEHWEKRVETCCGYSIKKQDFAAAVNIYKLAVPLP